MVETQDSQPAAKAAWPALAGATLRVAFGIIWTVNAAFTWTPQFAANYAGYLRNAADGQPAWSAFWFDIWIAIVAPNQELFLWLTRIAETSLALALIFGFARRSVYVLGALFSLLVWSTAEGFGGPYAVGATNMGVGISYVLIFAVLIVINNRSATSPYSVDYLIERQYPKWSWIAEWRAPDESPRPTAHVVPARVQVFALLGIGALVFFLVAGLHSSLNVRSATSDAAASAVSPLSLASSEPVKNPYDATLPPVPEGDVVRVTMDVTDETIEIASGVRYQAWPFGGSVPGPIIHARVGQTVHVVLTNSSKMPHSIDFHSSFTPPNLSFADIQPGEQIEFSFKADVAGAFVYHCGTDPVLLHMANGMYGAIIVDPVEELPPAREYVLVQSEWYTQHVSGKLMAPNLQKMRRIQPDVVAFNGIAFQYTDHPLTARPNERVRLYVVNAGPSLWSAFHVIGAIFDKVYPGGNPAEALSGVSTYSVGPGEGVVFDLVIPETGKYVFVDHAFAHLDMGAAGVLTIAEPGTTDFGTPNISKMERQVPKVVAAAGPYKFDAARGAELYSSTCSVCHQPDGSGMEGAFPPLKNNRVVLNSDPTKHILGILNGVEGEVIDGVSYPTPMPPFGDMLSDEEVADIANHERTAWGHKAKLVTAEQVKALRAAQPE